SGQPTRSTGPLTDSTCARGTTAMARIVLHPSRSPGAAVTSAPTRGGGGQPVGLRLRARRPGNHVLNPLVMSRMVKVNPLLSSGCEDPGHAGVACRAPFGSFVSLCYRALRLCPFCAVEP